MALIPVDGDRGAVALSDERQSLTWAAVDAILNRGANALCRYTFEKERRLAVFAPNAIEVALAHVAGLHAGVSTVPINAQLTADELTYILEDSGAEFLFVGPETAAVGLAAAARAGVGTVVGWRCETEPRLTAWNDWLASAPDIEPPHDLAPRAHLHYTSGTTGRPKATETPPNLFPAAETVEELFAAFRQRFLASGLSPAMIVSPSYHTGPMLTIRQFAGGQSLVILSKFDPEGVLTAIDKFAVQVTIMVPTHFQRLLALPEEIRCKYDVSSIRQLHHTGAACPRDVKLRMIDWFGPRLIEAYGATESGTTNVITSAEWLERQGSVGRALPQFEIMILSDEGERKGVDEIGQVYFRDRNGRGISFRNDPHNTLAVTREPGVFTLGELGYVDDAGYLFITDRISDMIVSGGVNIYPAEIEMVLIEHPQVADLAVIGVPNADFGEEVKALVVPRDPVTPPRAVDLEEYCRTRLAGYKIPRSFEFRGDIGRNAMGKVNKKELRRPFWPSDRTIAG